MRRRTVVGGGLGLVALGARQGHAQKPPAVIGLLGSGTPRASAVFIDSLKRGLSDLKMQEGADYTLRLRWAEGDYARFPALAKQLVEERAVVILATTISAVRAAQSASPTAVVMVSVTNAVAAGLVASLARPGGNTTGISNLNEDLTPKLLDFFREIAPQARKLAVLANPANPSTRDMLELIGARAAALGWTVDSATAGVEAELAPAFDRLMPGRPDALIVVPDSALIDLRESIAALALNRRLPLLSTIPEFTDVGGLIGYGVPRRDLYYRSAYFVKRILDGAKPGEIPVEQPARIEFSVNAATAATLGIRIPDLVLTRADRVID
jgi:putative ABC transport system substrate-binding protein